MQQISFSVDGQKLYGNLFYPEHIKEENPAILFLHGWRSSFKSPSTKGLPEALAKRGFICMNFDMRGHGISEGDITTLTRQNFLDDVLAAYDFLLQQQHVDKDTISVVGSSFGSYLATLLTRERKIKNVVLRVPANFSDETFNEPQINFAGDSNPEVLYWRFKTLGTKDTYALRAVNNFSGNILVVESEKDELVPKQTVENYVRAVKDKSKLTHIVMKGAGHTIHDERFVKEYTQIVLEWFKNKL